MTSLRITCSAALLLAMVFGVVVSMAGSLCANDEPSIDQLTNDQRTEIDRLFARWNRPDSPGAAVGVIKDGKLIYANGYGTANLEHEVPIDSRTVFYMASVSKHFVTFCILLLEEQGKLELDDEIQKYLPDFPKYQDPLTVRHFIHHTSGVRDHLTLWRLAGYNIMDHVDEDAIYELIKRQRSLNFKPGSQYMYSNSCYFMLTKIVEKVSGQSFSEFADANIFKPLGMKDSHFHDDVNRLVKRRADSYYPQGQSFTPINHRFDLVGSGGLYSTIEDMARWDQNFIKNKLGKANQDIINKMLVDGKLNDGKSCGYAFGLQNGKYKGRNVVEHGGALFGYRTHYVRFPEQGWSIVVLANVTNVAPSTRARLVADICFGERKAPPKSKSQPAKAKSATESSGKSRLNQASVDELTEYVGVYHSKELNASYHLFLKNKRLHFRILNRNHSNEHTISFVLKNWMMVDSTIDFLKFERKDGNVTGMTLSSGRVKNIKFIKK